MTRTTTAQLRRQLAEQEASDDAMASKAQSLMSWLEATERARVERDASLKAAIDEDQAAFFAELRTMKADLSSLVATLRGTPVAVSVDEAPTPRKLRGEG